MFSDPFVMLAVGTGGISAVLLIWFLIKKPLLTRSTKIVLLFGIGVLPIATAANGNIADYHATTKRRFCGSCHVMAPYAQDSSNPQSATLAARHARNGEFGDANCYACHANYGMYGTILTKLGGLRHVYEYTINYRNMPLEEFLVEVQIRQPFPNATCIHCHSTENPLWNAVGDHASTLDRIRAGTLSCASEGCHGPAHPFSKQAKAEAAAKAGGQ